MKKKKKKLRYVAPATERIDVKVESGFATSASIKKDDTNIDNWNLDTDTWNSGSAS
jgi:hypothetical protein